MPLRLQSFIKQVAAVVVLIFLVVEGEAVSEVLLVGILLDVAVAMAAVGAVRENEADLITSNSNTIRSRKLGKNLQLSQQ
jgi:hypothetical protein